MCRYREERRERSDTHNYLVRINLRYSMMHYVQRMRSERSRGVYCILYCSSVLYVTLLYCSTLCSVL